MDTHYERVMRVRCRLPVDDLHATCLRLSESGRELAIIDAIRQAASPGAHGTFQELVDGDCGQKVMLYLSSVVLALGIEDLESMRGELMTQMLMAWQLVRHEDAGKRVYVVSPGLQRRLLATELRGLRCGDVRLPYPCVYVEVDPALGFRVWHEVTGWHELYGVYLTEDAGGLRFFTCGLGKEGGDIDDSLSHFHLDLSDAERPLDDALDALFSRVVMGEAKWAREQGFGQAHMDELIDSWRRPFKWAMALLFYLTHGDPEVEHVELDDELRALYRRRERARGKKRERIDARIHERRPRPRIVVGRGVKVDKRLPKTAGEARTLLVRSLVAGHWQRYHVGPGRAETVFKFREPFWRGQGPEGPIVHEVR